MPRPRPLTGISTARAQHLDSQLLTPRTPLSGSRTSRAEQGFAKLQVTEADEDDAEYDPSTTTQRDTLQSAPLLASSSTVRFAARSRAAAAGGGSKQASDRTRRRDPAYFLALVFSRVPLAIGVLLAAILLILIFLSFTKPEALHRYVGAKLPSTSQATAAASAISTQTSTAQVHKETFKIVQKPGLTTNPSPGATHGMPHMPMRIISYENYTSFPLKPQEYVAECAKLNSGFMSHGDYWDIGHMGPMDVEHHDDNQEDAKGKKGKTCSSTVTYMLDGTVGLTADLALMAQIAALARERNRTFFVDDRNWNRGKWTEHFEDVRRLEPGPEPGCEPPPNELVACPRTARHWIVTSHTAKYHLGHGFSNHYEDPYAHDLNRLHPIFDFSRKSFDSIIRPNTHTTRLIELARQELGAFIRQGSTSTTGAPEVSGGGHYLAVHIRQGDRKPASFRFPNQRIPIQDYVKAAAETWSRVLKLDSGHNDKESTLVHDGEDAATAAATPVYYVASDSRDADRDFMAEVKDGGKTFSLFTAKDARLRELASPGQYFQKQFTTSYSLEERVLATRGALVDLALISGMWAQKDDLLPEAVVCSVSTSFCRLAAVGMGWTRAFGNVNDMGRVDQANKRWVEIDLRGDIVPVWTAFELF